MEANWGQYSEIKNVIHPANEKLSQNNEALSQKLNLIPIHIKKNELLSKMITSIFQNDWNETQNNDFVVSQKGLSSK